MWIKIFFVFKLSPCSKCNLFLFWVIPRRLSSNCRRFGTHYRFHLHRQVSYFIGLPMKMEPIVSSETKVYGYSFQALYISRSLPHGLAWQATQGRTWAVYKYRITLNRYSTWSRKKTMSFSCHYLRVLLISSDTGIIGYVDLI